jgi:microcin C transport system substrate-binding protein
MRAGSAIAAGLVLLLATGRAGAAASEGMSLFGDLKYGTGFTHFDYANPQAPKGGTIRYSAIGTYDTLNPFVINGVPAAGIGMIFDTLTASSEDEPASEYGLIAKSIDLAPDKLSVLYTLRKEARFHDGTPMTPEDVIWTFETLRAKGQPLYREYYGDVTKVEKEGDRGVRFYFKSAKNRELPQIIGQMPVLSKAYW